MVHFCIEKEEGERDAILIGMSETQHRKRLQNPKTPSFNERRLIIISKFECSTGWGKVTKYAKCECFCVTKEMSASYRSILTKFEYMHYISNHAQTCAHDIISIFDEISAHQCNKKVHYTSTPKPS